jgi:hypothetical protein
MNFAPDLNPAARVRCRFDYSVEAIWIREQELVLP